MRKVRHARPANEWKDAAKRRVKLFERTELYPPEVKDANYLGKNIVVVGYPPELWDYAIATADHLLSFYARHYGKSDSQERKNRNRIGIVAQLSFYHYANKGNWKDLATKNIPIGKPDKHDFLFREYSVDIKGADQPDVPRLLVKVSQFEKRQYDIYVLVWVKPETHEAWVLGYATKEEVARATIDPKLPHEPAHAIEFQRLHEPREALDLPFKG